MQIELEPSEPNSSTRIFHVYKVLLQSELGPLGPNLEHSKIGPTDWPAERLLACQVPALVVTMTIGRYVFFHKMTFYFQK